METGRCHALQPSLTEKKGLISYIKPLKGNLLKPPEWCWQSIKQADFSLCIYLCGVIICGLRWAELCMVTCLHCFRGFIVRHQTEGGVNALLQQRSPKFMPWAISEPGCWPDLQHWFKFLGNFPASYRPRQWECLLQQHQHNNNRYKARIKKHVFVSMWDSGLHVDAILVSQHASTFALTLLSHSGLSITIRPKWPSTRWPHSHRPLPWRVSFLRQQPDIVTKWSQ